MRCAGFDDGPRVIIRSGRRFRLLAFVSTLAGGALALLAWTQDWFQLTLTGGSSLSVPGRNAAPALSALGLALLALVGALAIARPRTRQIFGLLGVIIGAVTVVLAAVVILDPLGASSSTVTLATAIAGPRAVADAVETIASTPWPALAVLAGILGVSGGLLTVVTAPRWPGATQRYELAGGSAADAGSIATQPAGAQGARDRERSDWDSLSGGEDPTVAPDLLPGDSTPPD